MTLAIRPEMQKLLAGFMASSGKRDAALATAGLLTNLLLAEERHMERLSIARQGPFPAFRKRHTCRIHGAAGSSAPLLFIWVCI